MWSGRGVDGEAVRVLKDIFEIGVVFFLYEYNLKDRGLHFHPVQNNVKNNYA